jgi:hypothetical protein
MSLGSCKGAEAFSLVVLSRRMIHSVGANYWRKSAIVEVGTKVIIYTTVIRGSTQASFHGTIVVVNEHGIVIEGPSGKTFFPYAAIERMTF